MIKRIMGAVHIGAYLVAMFQVVSGSWLENGMSADVLEIDVMNEGRGSRIQISGDLDSDVFLSQASKLCLDTFVSSTDEVPDCVQSLQQYLSSEMTDSLPFSIEVLRAISNESLAQDECLQEAVCAQVVGFGPAPINNKVILPGDILAVDIQVLGSFEIATEGAVCLAAWRHANHILQEPLMLASSCYASQPALVTIPDHGQSHRVRLSGEGLVAGTQLSLFIQLREAKNGKPVSVLRRTDIQIEARGPPCGFGLQSTAEAESLLHITSPAPGSTFLTDTQIEVNVKLDTDIATTDDILVCLRLGGLRDFGGVELESSGTSLGCLNIQHLASIRMQPLPVGVHGILAYARHKEDFALTPTTTTWFQVVQDPQDCNSSDAHGLEDLHSAVFPYETMGGAHGHDNKLDAIVSAIKTRLLLESTVHFCETGFNAGYSALTALSVDPRVSVTSFDIAENAAVIVAKAWIDQRFPKRHTLIYGTSTVTLPSAIETDIPLCDVVYVDGGHEEATAEADMRNFKLLSRRNAPLIVDDISCSDPTPGACDGPGVAWRRLLAEEQIAQSECPDDHGGSFCVGNYR